MILTSFDLLTDRDKFLIEKYIKYYGPTSTDYMDWTKWAGFETILKQWNENKNQHLLKMMGNELILTRPYTYTAQSEALMKDIAREMENNSAATAFSHWWWKISHMAGNDILIDPKPLSYSQWWYIEEEAFSPKALASNAFQGENATIIFPSGKRVKVFKGMKPMKILSHFIKEFDGDEDMYDAFRIWHSMQLNQKHIDGKLCLSIHPLDYMTMSDNANDWHSCMRWMPTGDDDWTHGDYRGGTVACMNSPYILVAYLHNDKHKLTIDDDWEWNSKQWRELFIVQEGIINEIKGYCFQDENLTNTCLLWINELAEKNLGWTYDDEEIDVGNEIPLQNGKLNLTFNTCYPMYNDMGTLPIHRGRINLNKLLGKYSGEQYYNDDKTSFKRFIDIDYGGVMSCMCCGKIMHEDNVTDTVICQECDDVKRCAKCGQPIWGYEYYWVEEYEDPICASCWDDDCGYDSFDDSAHDSSEMDDIYLLIGYDDDGNPVWHNYTASCHDYAFNYGYKKIMKENPMTMNVGTFYPDLRLYVTIGMVEEDYKREFCDIFNLPYADDLTSLFTDADVARLAI